MHSSQIDVSQVNMSNLYFEEETPALSEVRMEFITCQTVCQMV